LLQIATSRVLKKTPFAGWSKTLRYKAPEMPACGKQGEDEGNSVAGGQLRCWRATPLLEGNSVAGGQLRIWAFFSNLSVALLLILDSMNEVLR
jgi:hypothetical protein